MNNGSILGYISFSDTPQYQIAGEAIIQLYSNYSSISYYSITVYPILSPLKSLKCH